MHPELTTRRRVLLLTYQRYAAADLAWTLAQREVKAWFPAGSHHSAAIMGDPGSSIRRLYDQRKRAILQLEVALSKLEVAKHRLALRHREIQRPLLMLMADADY